MTVADSRGPKRRLTESASETELQACVSDLMHLLSLPAMWHGKDPDQIQRQLCETLEATLSLEACYVCTRIAAGEPLAGVLRIRGAFIDAANPAWRCLVDAAGEPHSGPPSMIDDTPVGALRMISYDMGFFGEGSVCVASSDPGFPTATQALVLKAAVTLAASALHSARLIREQEETRRAREAFLAVLGHELRNPLAPIVTALDLIKLRARAGLPREIEIIDRQVGRLTRLVDEMVDMSRLGRGKITLAKEPVEMSAVVAKAVERVSASIEQRRHALRVDVPESGLTVDGDPARLAQIVRHLLDNAAKYTAPGGRIAVTAWREDDHIKLSVSDNGMGIDPDVLPRLFDRFQDARTNVERAPGGLGIGLSIVSRLAELHGGSVSASSEGRGRGSEFVVTLPAHPGAEPAKHSETAPRTDAAVQPERVLVVDDNRDAAELVAAVLSSAGHDVSVAHDALQALSLIARLKPGVVVLDIGLPVMDGYELASRIREAFGENSPRLVAVTGYSLDEDRARSRDIGIDIHLVKPVDVQKLIEAVGARSTAVEHYKPPPP